GIAVAGCLSARAIRCPAPSSPSCRRSRSVTRRDSRVPALATARDLAAVPLRMPSIEVAPITIASLETAPNIQALLAEYGAESAIAGMPAPAVKVETYRALEAGGLLHAIA